MSQTKVEAPFVANNANFRNYIINGDMSIWQRATSATAVSNGSYSACDRWHFPFYSTDGAMTTEREALSVADQATTGMYYCNLLKCTTADTSVAADSIIQMRQTIEAQFCQPFNYGTSAAKTLTLSFYAKANASKTYGVSLWKRDSTAYYWFQDISVTTSWQRFEIVISPTAGSTSLITSSNGAIANDNGEGLEVSFVLASGSNYQATADTWTSNQDFNTSNLDNFLSSTDNTFRVTGVQLEIGSGSTDFEHLPHDVQLQRCKRYYQKLTGSYAQYGQIMNGHYNGTSQFQGACVYPVQMRASPTLSHTTTSSNNTSSAYAIATVGSVDYIDALLLYNSNDHSTLIYTAGNASNDQGMGGNMYVQSTITELALVSEL
jgi:hypothetical protein